MKGAIPLDLKKKSIERALPELGGMVQEAEKQAARIIEKQKSATTAEAIAAPTQPWSNKERIKPLPGWVRAAAELDDIKKMDMGSEACTRRLQRIVTYFPPEDMAEFRKDNNTKTMETIINLINKETQKK